MCPVSWPIHLHTALGGVVRRVLYLSNRDVEVFSSGSMPTNQSRAFEFPEQVICVLVTFSSFD
jgi:hypothetical protein